MSIRAAKIAAEGAAKIAAVSTRKFARIPLEVLGDSRLSNCAIRVYGALASAAYYAGTVSMGSRLIAKTAGVSERSVYSAIAELVDAGYVHRWEAGAGKRQKYLLTSPIFARRQGKEDLVVEGENTPRLASVKRRVG